MKTELLGSMDDAALRRYFERNARHSAQMPVSAQYFIRIGSISICSSDTADLWNEFEKAVRLIKEKTMGLDQNGTWKPGPTECFNKECGRDLRQINPTYTLREKSDVAWCSQACRATYTKEKVESRPAPRPAEAAAPAPEPTKKKALTREELGVPMPSAGKAAKAAPATKASKPEGEKKTGPGRAATSPWSNLAGKLHLTGKTPPNFQGNRKIVWELIKNGMTVQALYDACDKAGVEGKSNLAKIIGVYGCAEVK